MKALQKKKELTICVKIGQTHRSPSILSSTHYKTPYLRTFKRGLLPPEDDVDAHMDSRVSL